MNTCAPNLHDGERVQADYRVEPAENMDVPLGERIAVRIMNVSTRFACCEEHLPYAVAWVMRRANTNKVIIRSERS